MSQQPQEQAVAIFDPDIFDPAIFDTGETQGHLRRPVYVVRDARRTVYASLIGGTEGGT